MGKSSPSTPAPPDPRQLAATQAQANAGTARVQQRLNMIDEDTPWYSTSYTDMGDRTRNPDGSSRNGPPIAVDPAPGGGAPNGSRPQSSVQPLSQDDWNSRDISWRHANPQYDPSGPNAGVRQTTPGSPAPPDGSSLDGEQAYYNQDRSKRTIELNPEDQKILDQQRRITQGLGGVAEDQIPRVKSALGQTSTYEGLPANVTGVDYNKLQAVDPNFRSGQVQSQLDFSGLPGLDNGQIMRSLGPAGEIQMGVGDAGPIRRSVNAEGQWDYNDVGGPSRGLNIQDPTQFTMGVNDTLYQAASSRFEPQIAQEREQLRQSLADRGIPEDSEAAQRELTRFDQQAGDMRLQASASATDRAADQASKLFGMDLSRFGAENAAQDQAFRQTAMQRGDLFGQELATGQFENAAQGQQFGQNLSAMQAGNQAQQQQFGQNLAGAEFSNRAQEQGFGQSMSARDQMARELTQQGTFANQAQQQDFSQGAARQQLALALRQAGLSEQQINAALAAQAREAGYAEQENVRTQPIRDTMAILGGQ